jgi:D-serine deaminase-like pyridoxal phosphate-dependent protein
MNTDALAALSSQPLDWRARSAPVTTAAHTVREFVASRPGLFDAGLLPPIMTIRESTLRRNVAEMAAYCDRNGVRLAPHGKTHMAPQLAARQLAAGAWGVTVANAGQARVYRAFGVPRIFCANELVDTASIGWASGALDADPDFTFVCYVDSVEGVRLLGRTLADLDARRPIDVVVELGFTGGRTGCRDLASATALALEASRQPRLRLVGVSGFEGGLGHGHERDPAVSARVHEFLRWVREAGTAVAAIAPAGNPFYVSAGGSAYFDLVVEDLLGDWYHGRPATVLLRSGCYLIHDSGHYERQTPFGRTVPGSLHATLRLWGAVLSRPEPGLALVGIGRRDASFDMDLPVPQVLRRAGGALSPAGGLEVTGLDDQHAYVRLDAGVQVSVGDWVGFGLSHPCTALDKWRLLMVVDDDDRIVDCVRTFF